MTAAQSFPGATGVTLLDVYDWPTADGLRGGSAHIHLASTEGYVVLRGAGRLQTLGSHGYQETPGRVAAEMLGDLIGGTPLRSQRVELSTELVIRDSTGRPGTRGPGTGRPGTGQPRPGE